MWAAFCTRLLALFGWRLEADFPATRKYVLVVAPHTSNWDFVIGLLAAWALGLDVHWMGKDSLFRGPLGPMFRMIGGIPVHRDSARNMIEQMAERFRTSEQLILGLAPEGTRSKREHWKSGFYFIALEAGVEITLSALDYSRKKISLGGSFAPTGDVDADFARISAFYKGKSGRYPDQESNIRVRQMAS